MIQPRGINEPGLLRHSQQRLNYEALKRAATVLHRDGLAGVYGEPPPPPATAEPSLYYQSPPVFTAVSAYANLAASTPLRLYEVKTDGEKEEVKNHPALDVLQNPNPFLTRFELFFHLAADWNVGGNAFWFMAGPQRGAPTEIWRCQPRRTRLIRDKVEYISGYVTEIDGELVPLLRDEVTHFRMPHMLDDFYGAGKLTVAAMAAQTGRAMDEWNYRMFKQDYAVPTGMVAIDGNMTPADFEKFKSEWKRNHGGGGRRTAFLLNANAQFQAVGLNQTDVDFLEGKKHQREIIYRVFGTEHLLDPDNADTSKMFERRFLEGHAWPFLVYVSEVLTDQLMAYWPGKWLVEFDDIRPRERSLDLEEQRERAKGLFFNEWRRQQGLEPKPGWDDILYVQAAAGMTPAMLERQEKEPEREPTPEPPAPAPEPEDEPESDAVQPEDAQERAERRENAGSEYGDDVGERHNKSIDWTAVHRELGQWERFALKRWESDDARPFRPNAIPAVLAHIVQTALDDCDSEAAVKTVFERTHEVVDGKLTAKGSFGAPEPEESTEYGNYDPDSIKAIQATRLEFEMEFDDLLAAYRNEDIDRRQWSQRARTILRKYADRAYRDGLNDGGVVTLADAKLSDDDQTALNVLLAEQSKFVTELGRVLKEQGITDTQANGKAAMWFNKSIKPVYQAGRLSAAKNAPHLWIHNPLKKNCRTCLTASGQVHRLKDWHKGGILPQSEVLICRGFRCGCRLQNAAGTKARGRLDRIPLYAGKADEQDHEHDEGEPMAAKPDSLPASIWNEMDRVLGRRIEVISDDNGLYALTLREEAGYYKSEIQDEEAVRQGLHMLDERLVMDSYEMPDDERMIVRFRVKEVN